MVNPNKRRAILDAYRKFMRAMILKYPAGADSLPIQDWADNNLSPDEHSEFERLSDQVCELFNS
jgi:hypothetical protein